MQASYHPDTDSVIISTGTGGGFGSDLWGDTSVILGFDDEDCEVVTGLELLSASIYLPLAPERGYDAESDTLTLGEKPVANYRVVDSGEFVHYLQWCNDDVWESMALVLCNASKHLKQVNEAILRKEKQRQDSGKLRAIR